MKRIICLILIAIMHQSCSVSCISWYKNNKMKVEISGIVEYKFIDTTYGGRNQNIVGIMYGNGDIENYPLSNYEAWSIIDSGDHIYKRKGSLEHFIIKGKGQDSISFIPCGGINYH